MSREEIRLDVKLVCVIITNTYLVILKVRCSQNGCGEVISGNITLVTLVTIVNLLNKAPMETKRYHSFLRNIDKFDNEDIHNCTYLRKMSFVFA